MARTNYICPRCHYETHHLSCYKGHLQRKTTCEATYDNIAAETILENLQKSKEESKKFKCTFCDKRFGHRQSKYLHQRDCVGDKADMDISDRLKALEHLLSKASTAEQNVTINNITNNIQINAFNREDLSHISKPFLDRCVKRTNKGLVELVERMHFSDSASQNNNMRITNKKLPFIQTHNGNKWMLERKDKVLNEVVVKGHSMMQEHFEEYECEFKEQMSKAMFEFIKDWIEKMSDCDKKVMETVLTDIYLLILNNS